MKLIWAFKRKKGLHPAEHSIPRESFIHLSSRSDSPGITQIIAGSAIDINQEDTGITQTLNRTLISL